MTYVRFGIKTTPMHVSYDDVRRVWLEADDVPEIEDAWLWDHLLPVAGQKDGQVHEGWTLLGALAAQTSRLRLGLLVTSDRIRPPALLGKMAATLDVISSGRLVVGLGVGGTHQPPGAGGIAGDNPAIAEYEAYGLTLVPPTEGLARLAETAEILKLMWTRDVFDFEGRHHRLKGTRCEPKPVQRPGPPLLIGGWGPRLLRLAAEHADIWNVPGPPSTPTSGTSRGCRTTPSPSSPSAPGSWTPTARTSAATRPASPAPCRSWCRTTTRRPPVGRSPGSSPPG